MPQAPITPAATIILLKDVLSEAASTNFEILMVERNKAVSFAGGALVFPGGRIDPADSLENWADHADGLPDDPTLAASMVGAIRESFEEAGILLARCGNHLIDNQQAALLQHHRKSIETDAAQFLDLIKSEGLRLACDQLTLFAHWSPPSGLHGKRFDTLFFVAKTPTDQVATPDGSEITDLLWTTPEDAITAHASGSRKMIFPTIRNVELLGLSKTHADVVRFAKQRKIERIVPTLVERPDGSYVTIPSDLGYPITEENIATAFRV